MTLDDEKRVEDKVTKILDDIKQPKLVISIKSTFNKIKLQSAQYSTGSNSNVVWFIK